MKKNMEYQIVYEIPEHVFCAWMVIGLMAIVICFPMAIGACITVFTDIRAFKDIDCLILSIIAVAVCVICIVWEYNLYFNNTSERGRAAEAYHSGQYIVAEGEITEFYKDREKTELFQGGRFNIGEKTFSYRWDWPGFKNDFSVISRNGQQVRVCYAEPYDGREIICRLEVLEKDMSEKALEKYRKKYPDKR